MTTQEPGWEALQFQAELYAQANRELERRIYPQVLQMFEDAWEEWLGEVDNWAPQGITVREGGDIDPWTVGNTLRNNGFYAAYDDPIRPMSGRHPNWNPTITKDWKL